jgi:sRNA-binding protein
MNKSRKKIAQDYSRNAMADAKSSSAKIRKEGKYEAKEAVRAASGAPVRMESSKQEKKNLMKDMPVDKSASALNNLNKGYGNQVKSPMNMGGSWMSKHSKSRM